MSFASLQIQIEALDAASAPIQKISNEIEKLEKFSSSATKVGENLQRVGEGLTRNVTLPVAAGLGLAARSAIQFEENMADAAKTLGTNQAQTKALGQDLLAMTRTLPMSANGLAQIAAAGGQLGIAAEDIQGFVEVTAKMGTAFDMSADQAGDSIAKLMNVYGLNLEGVQSMGDAINHISNNSAASAGQIVDAATRIGGTANQFGLAETEALALAGSIIALGRPPEVAATAISSMLPMLQTASGQTAKFQEGLEMAGLSATQLEQAIAQDAMGGIQLYIDALGQMDEQQRALAIQNMFGTGSDAQVIAQLASDSSVLAKNLELVGDQASYAGSMQAEFEARAATTANKLQLAKNAAVEVGIGIGDAMLPAITQVLTAMTPLIQKFAEFAMSNPGIMKVGVAIAGIAAALGPVLIFVGSIVSAVGTLMPIITAVGVAIAGVVSAPILAAIALLAGFAALIAANWERVVPTFQRVWAAMQNLVAAFAPLQPAAAATRSAISALGRVFMKVAGVAINALGRIVVGMMNNSSRVLSVIINMGARIISALANIAAQAFSAGARIVQRIAAGIMSGIGAVANAAKSVGAAVMSALPNSPVPTGPLTALNNPATSPGAKIVDMLSAGILSRAGQAGQAIGQVLSPAASPAGMFAGSGAPSTQSAPGGSNTFNITLNVSEGMADAAIEQLEGKIDELMGRYNARRERLSFG